MSYINLFEINVGIKYEMTFLVRDFKLSIF